MTARELSALAALRFNTVQNPDDVWRPSQFHVDGMHRATLRTLREGFAEAREGDNPLGVVVQGRRGSGKTHLLGWVREEIQGDHGYFFLVTLLDAKSFWQSVVVALLDGLSRESVDGWSQLKLFLQRLCQQAGVSRTVRRAVIGDGALTREHLDSFVGALRRLDRALGGRAQDTARALVLLAAEDPDAQDVGELFLSSEPEEERGERERWGIRQVDRTPQEIVRDVSHLLALTGPTVIAIDQIDALVAQSALATKGDGGVEWEHALVIEQIGHGLMALREITRRTLTVLCALPQTWVSLREIATDTLQDRFRETRPLGNVPDARTGREIIEKRFAVRYHTAGFTPPYPTWPIKPSAFDRAPEYTARQLLIRVGAHIRDCVLDERVTELAELGAASDAEQVVPPRQVPDDDLTVLDAKFAELRDWADVSGALNPAKEDAVMPALLSAGLAARIVELGEGGRAFGQDPPPSAKPVLHARLRRNLDDVTEDAAHWAFRAIAAEHPIAALTRLRKACVAAGLTSDAPKRRLFILRNDEWSGGKRTREAVTAFEQAGGRRLSVDEADLRILAALRDLLAEDPPNLQAWLVDRRPTQDVKVLAEALGDVWSDPEPRVPAPEPRPEAPVADGVPSLVVGRAVEGGDAPVRVALEALRRHTAIFAGSGSGKTVLIRRLVEECALQGVSAIVLDPNNDLARLGEAWPEPPAYWEEGDAERAARYLEGTDVVIWTPGRAAGRPLTFQPLPDFAGVAGDPDEYAEAVESAVAAIVPRVKLDARTTRAQLGQAVLRETVRHYGRRPGTATLKGLADLLAELPEGVSELGNAQRIAADLAEALRAAMVNDPLFGGQGTPVDPGVLLTPPPGKRARISVISLVGLPGDEQRQGFVNRLQMALFAWIKRNPAGERPLGGLFVMDEAQTFAPSGSMTACTRSTLALASQARKYGLGLVFATQAPKGLHNRIPGNAATQFFGMLNSPIQIEAAKEMARAKGSGVGDIAQLRTGQFYAAVEGAPFVKVRAPMCLSRHPRSPLASEEVIARAARNAG
ncbi:hypothetical protein HNP84_008316 [Thermocatellispora tengchongensis]|uniref:AAA+ ATPase domain-containing protein n=2 Tax=Thermocatellispora tengchongensis TaxID=1073253 RepID=A0A840PHE8_9ACTN|nr:ATP-binding protein [Thermocatellispora tengchongensis]MBB5138562.1 hypothetical protein [Thermocatellispora tengchongensis]